MSSAEQGPTSEEVTPALTYKSVNKKFILVVSVVAIAVIGVVALLNLQANSKFNEFTSEVQKSIANDQLDQAKSKLLGGSTAYGEKVEYKDLNNEIASLIKSRQDFNTAEKYFSQGNYSSAIAYYKRVIDTDTFRFGKSQSKISQSSELAIASAIDKALALKSKRNYSDALDVLDEVTSFAQGSAEFNALKDELRPLAAEQLRKEEAAKNAKYLSALRSMRTQKDSFNGITFYTDRTTPYYADNSKFYLYIGQRAGSEPYLRMEVRYSDDDWLFVKYAEIKIDGSVYDFDISSSEWETDNGSGDIWEWADVSPTSDHLDIINKVIKSKSAVIRFTGSQYYDDRTISLTQKRAFVNVLNAYEALKRGLG
jgi:tetratricopeptide (TPR) repeat protein